MSTQHSKELVCAPPVFILNREAPDNVGHIELFEAAEKITGFGTMVACQRIGAVWRIHGSTYEVRAKLVSKKLLVRGLSVPIYSQNPLSYRDKNGQEIPSTRLSIDGVPVSIATVDLEGYLLKAGAKLRSPITWERVKYSNGQLSRCHSGRRFVWIDLPPSPLPKVITIGTINAFLYYREQPKTGIICFRCKLEGHRRGDPICKYQKHAPQQNRHTEYPSDSNEGSILSESELDSELDSDLEADAVITHTDSSIDADSTLTIQSGPSQEDSIFSTPASHDVESVSSAVPVSSGTSLVGSVSSVDNGDGGLGALGGPGNNEIPRSIGGQGCEANKKSPLGNKKKKKKGKAADKSSVEAETSKDVSLSCQPLVSDLFHPMSPANGRKRPERPSPSPNDKVVAAQRLRHS